MPAQLRGNSYAASYGAADKRNKELDFEVAKRFRSYPRMSLKTQLEELVLKMYRSGMSYRDAVKEFKKAFLENALKETSGHQVNAARHLGIHRNSLARNMGKLRLDVHGYRPNSRLPPKSVERFLSQKRASP